MDQTLAFATQPGPAPNSPVSCSYSRLKLLKTLNSPWVSHPIFSLLSITSVHSCEESGPARQSASLRKAWQGFARQREVPGKIHPQVFPASLRLFPISFLSALSYSAVKHPLRVWALISNPVKKSPRLNKEIRSLGIQGLKKLRKLIQLM